MRVLGREGYARGPKVNGRYDADEVPSALEPVEELNRRFNVGFRRIRPYYSSVKA